MLRTAAVHTIFLLGLAALSACNSSKVDIVPEIGGLQSDLYELSIIEGRNVYVDIFALRDHPERTRHALDILENQLEDIDDADMQQSAKSALQSVDIYVDWNKVPNQAVVYHPNADWLASNSYIPEKFQSINILNVNNFISYVEQNQPSIILHELSHAYHNQILGYNHAEIQSAYDNAINSGLYNSVPYYNGVNVVENKVAYAQTNPREYFSEMTEAYYGRNEYFPFDRYDLEKYDPFAFSVLRKIWEDRSFDPDSISFDENKYYRLTSLLLGSEQSLGIVNDASDNKMVMEASALISGQLWKLVKVNSDGYYRLTTQWLGDGSSVGVVSALGFPVELMSTEYLTGQHWRIEKIKDKADFFRITSEWKGIGMSLTIDKVGENYVTSLQPTDHNSSEQSWLITEVQ